MQFIAIVIVLIIFIILLIISSVWQLKTAGINVKDFWDFINANQRLDDLYVFAKKYNKMSPNEQVMYLNEAEKIFEAFDKVPKVVWEEEYEKFSKVLDTYKDIKVTNWSNKVEKN